MIVGAHLCVGGGVGGCLCMCVPSMCVCVCVCVCVHPCFEAKIACQLELHMYVGTLQR